MSMFTRKLMKGTLARSLIRNFATEGENQPLERSFNHVQLLGRVGNEPQKRGSEEHPVVIFSLATHSIYKSKSDEGLEQTTDWHRICVFKPRLRDTVYNYLRKGQRVYVSGKLNYGETMNAKGTEKVMVTSIIADDVIFFNS